MPAEPRILVLDHDLEAVGMMERGLRRAGVAFALRRVEGREDFLAALAEFAPKLAPPALKAAQAAAAIMAMNNVYYRFVHLVEKDEYSKLPAKLRMNVMASPGTTKENFELWSLAK